MVASGLGEGSRQVRLPWVSRELYEQARRRYDEQGALYAHDMDYAYGTVLKAERERYDSLLTKYHALKLQGAVVVEPIVPVERKEIDPVTQRINVLSAGKPGLRAAMMKQVQSDRLLNGLDDMAILQRIEAGVTTDEGVMA